MYARIRSSSKPQEGSGDVSVVDGVPGKVRAKNFEFNLDNAFGSDAQQTDVYNSIGAPLVKRVVEGYNACVIAYGQTGSGKTFTMLGPEGAKLDGSGGAEPGLGIVPRACLELFKLLPTGYTVTTSYIEVYNDNVNDLLTDGNYSTAKYLPLRETSPGHVEPDGITRKPVKNTANVMAAIALGDSRRVVAAMAMNPRSSRGHGIIHIEAWTSEGNPHGRLTLVDLAGMESSKKSAAVDQNSASGVKARQEEAKRINMSLLALSSVVNALASKGAMRVPFRDAKLTRLLQSSLAGNCKAAFCVMLRGEKENIEEAILTLKFAQRASAVAATVVKNEETLKSKGGGAANKKLEEELAAQKASLAAYQEKLSSAEDVKAAMMAQVQNLLSEMQALQKDSEEAKRKARQDAHHDDSALSVQALEKRVQQLESRNRALEDENRLLRQRDIMHRLVELDGHEVAKDNLATFNTPVLDTKGFAMQFDNTRDDKEAKPRRSVVELRRESSGKMTYHTSGVSRWQVLRIAFKLSAKNDAASRASRKSGASRASRKSAKVAPAPRKKLSKEDAAAVKIQAVWRGKMVRDELAFWDYTDYMYG